MARFLNIGVIQMAMGGVEKHEETLRYIEEKVNGLMGSYMHPELIVGVELPTMKVEKIPGPTSEFFSGIAKKHGIYFIPGTFLEASDALPEGQSYNSAPIFGPRGELIDIYRKMAPYRPGEPSVPGTRYVVFDIPEKKAKIGVQICYDLNFPEISRNEALMGAEVLVKLTADPYELIHINKTLHYARAIDNQCYLVSTNVAGAFSGGALYGNSMIVDPEGKLVWEAGETPCTACITIDLDICSRARQYGSLFRDHYMQHLRSFNFPMPYAGRIGEAPLYQNIPATGDDEPTAGAKALELGVASIGAWRQKTP